MDTKQHTWLQCSLTNADARRQCRQSSRAKEQRVAQASMLIFSNGIRTRHRHAAPCSTMQHQHQCMHGKSLKTVSCSCSNVTVHTPHNAVI